MACFGNKHYWVLSEKEHFRNNHSNVEPPQPDDGLRGEFLDIYVEHSLKKYRVNTVKRKTNKKRAKSRPRQKPKPKAPSPHFAGQVPPPIEFPDVNIKTEEAEP